jgi:hypothetical protein
VARGNLHEREGDRESEREREEGYIFLEMKYRNTEIQTEKERKRERKMEILRQKYVNRVKKKEVKSVYLCVTIYAHLER